LLGLGVGERIANSESDASLELGDRSTKKIHRERDVAMDERRPSRDDAGDE
jgi:hypothetical protein